MTPSDYMSAVSLVFGCISICLVVFQQINDTRQRRIESLIRIYDGNRELLIEGFASPQLFKVLADAPNVDPEEKRRYLQMWLNRVLMNYFILREAHFPADVRESLENDIRDFFFLKNMQEYW